MVASTQPLASEAGLRILRQGGNAADAGKTHTLITLEVNLSALSCGHGCRSECNATLVDG